MTTRVGCPLIAAILVAMAMVGTAGAQAPIPKVKPIVPVRPIPKVCNPNAWGDYLRKKRIVDELLDDWLTRSKAARHDFVQELKELYHEAKEENEKSKKPAEKIKSVAESYSDAVEARYSAEEAALAKETAEGIVDAAEGATEAGIIAELLLDAAKVGIAYSDYRDELAANDKDLQRVNALWQSALADLRQALSQSEACKRDRDKADADEALDDKAKAMIDDWSLGGTTYHNPHDPEGWNLDEQAALAEAKQILLGQRSGLRRLPSGFGFVYAQLGPAAPTTGARRAAAALIRVQRAHGFFRKYMDEIVAFLDAQQTFEQSIAEIRRGN